LGRKDGIRDIYTPYRTAVTRDNVRMSVSGIIVHHHHEKAECRTKPDLRLAESYIPAVVLCIKAMAYSTIAPIILLMQWKTTIVSVALFSFILYVDHMYLVLPGMLFIDTTAISLDVFGATLLVMVMSLLRPCTQPCQGILAFWTLCTTVHLLLAQYHIPHYCIHFFTLCFVMAFIYLDLQPSGNPQQAMGLVNVTIAAQTTHSLSFFARTGCYTSLSLVDAYLFRPLFQQENERLFFCKYGPVLLASWPWSVVFWVILGGVQVFRGLQLGGTMTASPPPPPPSGIQDLDVLEAFRLAKQQHMGGKGAN